MRPDGPSGAGVWESGVLTPPLSPTCYSESEVQMDVETLAGQSDVQAEAADVVGK